MISRAQTFTQQSVSDKKEAVVCSAASAVPVLQEVWLSCFCMLQRVQALQQQQKKQ